MKKSTWIILGIVVAVILLIVGSFASVHNRVVMLEEQIYESQSAVNTQEKRRVDLIYNLVDTVESYNKHEKDTLMGVVEARKSVANGDIVGAETMITAMVEAYPELKSNENYKELMKELSTTENLIANYRENLNIQIKSYNKMYRQFPNNVFLGIMGYEKIEVDYLKFDVSEDAPQNLFDRD